MTISNYLWFYALGALLIPGRPFYTTFYFMGALALLVKLSLDQGIKRVQMERRLSDERIFLGESVTVTLRFQNPSGIPVSWVQYQESRPVQLAQGSLSGVVTLAAGEQADVSYDLSGNRRGRFQIGPLELTAADSFGLNRFTGYLPALSTLTVYPRVSALPALGLPARLPMGDLSTRRRLFEDPAWLAGTRPYSSGDSMKRIHWRATARTGELVVKQFRHAMLLPCCIAVNLNQDDYPTRQFWAQSELAISAAASLSNYLVKQKQQVGVVITGRDPDGPGLPRLPLRHGPGSMLGILDLLARVQAVPAGLDFVSTVAAEARQMPWGTLVCLITPKETEQVAALCTQIGRGGQQVLLFVTDGVCARRPYYQVWALSEDRAGEVVVG